jgi:hypothetical protein
MNGIRDGVSYQIWMGVAVLILVVFGGAAIWYVNKESAKITEAQGLCNKWADKLDGETTDSGVYQRPADPYLPEKDPWGNALVVFYSRGGGMETLEVRSYGPDGKDYTPDDISSKRSSVNLAGIGSGVRDNIEETTEGGARGAVRGALDALNERGLLPGKRTTMKRKMMSRDSCNRCRPGRSNSHCHSADHVVQNGD